METGKEIPMRVIGGGECPKCQSFGIFIYPEFVICEGCLTRWDKDPRKYKDVKELK